MIFGNGIAAISSAHSATRMGARNVSARKENQMTWEKKIGNCGNAIAEIGGINFWQLWQWQSRKWEKKNVTKSVKE